LAVEEELGCPLSDAIESELAAMITPVAARAHWESIIQFMAGRRPGQCPAELRDVPGTEKCLALLYHGVDAVSKIRSVLGPTDPAKAPTGTIRKEFGQSIMVNAAHASDSAANAKREISLLNIAVNNFKPLIESRSSAS
jgi:nucleoside diphosphate kinase